MGQSSPPKISPDQPADNTDDRFRLWYVVRGILASFIGIQSRRAMALEMAQLEKNKRRLWVYLVVGFALMLAIHGLLYLIVLMILPEGSSRNIFR